MPNDAIVAMDEGRLPMSPEQVRTQVNHIQKIMEAVMQKGHHYGIIPGTKKPSLWKPGAEKLLSTFHLSVDYDAEDRSDHYDRDYLVKAVVTTADGIFVCSAPGTCSTREEKYAWRAAVCKEEWEETDETKRRTKYYKDGRKVQQVRSNPADMDNTVIKMAHKRAYVAVALLATAASDIFTQDVEDLPEHLLGGPEPAPKPIQTPKPTPTPPPAPKPAEEPSAPPMATDAPDPQEPVPAEPEPDEEYHEEEASTGSLTVIGVIEAFSKKAVKNGHRYGFKIVDQWYNTFSDTFGEMGDSCKRTGTPVKIEYIESQYGKDILEMERYQADE